MVRFSVTAFGRLNFDRMLVRAVLVRIKKQVHFALKIKYTVVFLCKVRRGKCRYEQEACPLISRVWINPLPALETDA